MLRKRWAERADLNRCILAGRELGGPGARLTRRLSTADHPDYQVGVCGLHGQAEFRLFSLFRRERRHGDTQEPNASGDRKERFEPGVLCQFIASSVPPDPPCLPRTSESPRSGSGHCS